MRSDRYGTWDSPLSSEMLARGNVRLGFPSFGSDGSCYFCELRSNEQGRSAVVRRLPDGRFEECLAPSDSARTRVHEYGGLSYLVHEDTLYFVQQRDQQLWQRPLAEPSVASTPLTTLPGTRFAEPILDRSRGRLIAVAEQHSADAVTNSLVAIDLDSGSVQTLASDRDFYAAPALSPDANSLAYVAWDHPNMPWDAAEVWCATLDAQGALTHGQHVAGDAQASAFQPTWSPNGTLYFSLELDGFWNLHRRDANQTIPVARVAAELGAPLWQLGTRLFEFVADDVLIGAQFEAGLSRLVRIQATTGAIETLSEQLAHIGQLTAAGDAVVCLLGWAGGGAELVRFDLRTRQTHSVRAAFADWLDAAHTSQPEVVRFATTREQTAYGFFYPPKNPGAQAPAGTLPPLIVTVHGGPSACTAPIFNPSLQYWTTRGFAVLDVNYRGSTGYGRAYRELLRGEWGVVDVEDCVAGARYLAQQGRVDGRQLLIRGGSAGGYTVLQALAAGDTFAAGACHYGISDLEALVRDTHKFESHYDRFLIGPYPERRDLFIARSPIHDVTRIRHPVVFFQGLDDRVVPADQTQRMAERLREHGIDAEYHGYAGEQHGFRKAETIRDVLDRELAFFRRVLGLAT